MRFPHEPYHAKNTEKMLDLEQSIYLATMHKQGYNLFDALTLTFQGQPPQPRFT
jgi:hypothetical protein